MVLKTSPKQMLFCVLTKTGKVPRLDFHPLRPMSWLRGGIPAQAGYLAQEHSPIAQSGSSRQCWGLAEEADLKARFPRSQPSSLREPGAQDSAGPQAPQATQTGAGPRKLPLLDTITTTRSKWWGWGRDSAAPRSGPGQRTAMARAPELCRTQPSACPQGPQLTCRPEAVGPGGPWGGGWDPPLAEPLSGPRWGWQLAEWLSVS